MLATDAYAMRDYQQSDFGYQRPSRLQTPGDELKDVMGLGREVKKPGKYAQFYTKDERQEDYEGELVLASVPHYRGPKNTRCDIIPMEDGRFEITGIVNHAQPSCVYLKQEFSVSMEAWGWNARQTLFRVRPFSIQRQFTKMFWKSAQCAQSLTINIEQQVKLAPYLCDAAVLKNQCKNKLMVRRVGGSRRMTLNFSLFEPLLGFQSGWALLDAARPFNQQNMKFPLAIQDYQIDVFKVSQRKDVVKRILRDKRLASTDDCLLADDSAYGEYYSVNVGIAARLHSNNNVNQGAVNVEFSAGANDNFKLTDISLVSYSDDSAKQENKSVSQVRLHAPKFMVFSKEFALPKGTVDFDSKTSGANLGEISRPIIMGGSDPTSRGAPQVKISINTSKGFPSFLLLYLEDFGVDFYDPTKVNSPDNVGYDTDCLIGSHPKIAALTVRVFGQDFPI